MKKIKQVINKILGRCDYCKRYFQYPKKRRTRTAYVIDSENYEVSCKDCFEEHDEYWRERWSNIY